MSDGQNREELVTPNPVLDRERPSCQPAMVRMDATVIIVTYNSAAYITECLASVRAQKGVQAEIIVVDNHSSDDTVGVVRGLGEGIHLIANAENAGFGRGNNLGFAASHGRFIYLLNPDAQLVRSDALAGLCNALDNHPRWGMAGNLVRSPDGKILGTQPHTTYPGQERARTDFSRLPGQVAWVLGASMCFRREVYAALGGFDPDFFLYAEETDICLRLRKLGHEIGFLKEVEVQHIGGTTEQDRDPYDVWTQRMQSLCRFWQKHFLPEDVRRLVRYEQLRSVRRILGYGLQALFRPPHSPAWHNLRQWQARRKAASRFLAAGLP